MKALLLPIVTLAAMATISCNTKTSTTAAQPPARHYQLKGKVVSIDDRAKMVSIDTETIAGFMEAMIMPYKIKPESELSKLQSGDAITADLVVQDETAWLQNVIVTGRAKSGVGR